MIAWGRLDRDELAVEVPFRSTCYLDSVVVSGGEILTSVLFQPRMADAICGGADGKVSMPGSVVLRPHVRAIQRISQGLHRRDAVLCDKGLAPTRYLERSTWLTGDCLAAIDQCLSFGRRDGSGLSNLAASTALIRSTSSETGPAFSQA